MRPGSSTAYRRSFVWNLLGTALYSLSQWVLLVFLARVSGPAAVGRLTLIFAISAPIFLTIGMNLRVVLTTDAPQRWRMADFFALQSVLNVVAGLSSIAVGALMGLHGSGLVAMVGVCAAKAVEARSQVYYGYFQLNGRFDCIARSMAARAIVGPAFFLGGLLTPFGLAAAVFGLATGWVMCQVLVDMRFARDMSTASTLPLTGQSTTRGRLVALTKLASPLGIDQGLSSFAVNIPRYAVQLVLGTSQLGVFGALAYLGQATSMLTSSLNIIFVSPLARYHHRGQRHEFVRVLLGLTSLALVILMTGPILAYLVGEPVLSATLGRQFADRNLLVVMMVAYGLANLQKSLCKALEASRRFRTYVLVDIVTTGVVAAVVVPFAHWWGAVGAAWAMAAGFGAGTLVIVPLVQRVVSDLHTTPMVGAQPAAESIHGWRRRDSSG